MRIALVTADFYPNVGGVAAHVVELGRALVQNGHDVHVLTLPLGDQREPVSNFHGMTVHRPWIPKSKPFYSWLMSRWIRNFTATTPLDVIHVHGLRPVEATVGLPIPVVFTNHTSGFLQRIERGEKERNKLARRMAHLDHVLAPSQELVDATLRVGYGGPTQFIANGVDVDRFCPNEDTEARAKLRNAWNCSPEDVVVLLARRLVEKNGVVVFAQAATELNTQAGVRIVFAGDGPEREKVERILAEGSMLEHCVFLGNVPNTDMPSIYRAADISVLPSFMEATSITGLESMASGLPLVGTRVGGIPTLIDEECTGILVEPGQPIELAMAIGQLIDDEARRQTMGVSGRQKAINEFSWKHIAEKTAEVYRSHLSKAA